MPVTEEKTIQLTLFDYFRDVETFTIKEAEYCVQQFKVVKSPSVRARIYEGIDKGIFKRVSKGVYTVDNDGVSCMLINGNGRDLSNIEDNSIDAIITDHPYLDKKSLKGGNRNFAKYDCFQYNEKDFEEKARVLKPGCFLVEFLPEENANNYKYLFEIKEMAEAKGLQYYAKVSWKKGDFVANTGRKSKNTEDIVFFTKGSARKLRIDAKKEKEYWEKHTIVEYHNSDLRHLNDVSYECNADIKFSVLKSDKEHIEKFLHDIFLDWISSDFKIGGNLFNPEELNNISYIQYTEQIFKDKQIEFVDMDNWGAHIYMSGASEMLPAQFDYDRVPNAQRIHQAEKPVDLLEKIICLVTKENELVLDQFAGSGSLGEAALNKKRNCILIEKDAKNVQRIKGRIKKKGKSL